MADQNKKSYIYKGEHSNINMQNSHAEISEH